MVTFDELLKEANDPILTSYCGGELPTDCFFSSLDQEAELKISTAEGKASKTSYKESSLKEDIRKSDAMEKIALSMTEHHSSMKEMNEARMAYMKTIEETKKA